MKLTAYFLLSLLTAATMPSSYLESLFSLPEPERMAKLQADYQQALVTELRMGVRKPPRSFPSRPPGYWGQQSSAASSQTGPGPVSMQKIWKIMLDRDDLPPNCVATNKQAALRYKPFTKEQALASIFNMDYTEDLSSVGNLGRFTERTRITPLFGTFFFLNLGIDDTLKFYDMFGEKSVTIS